MLLADRQEDDHEILLQQARIEGAAEIEVPRVIIAVRELPLLGSGKVDYAAARLLGE